MKKKRRREEEEKERRDTSSRVQWKELRDNEPFLYSTRQKKVKEEDAAIFHFLGCLIVGFDIVRHYFFHFILQENEEIKS